MKKAAAVAFTAAFLCLAVSPAAEAGCYRQGASSLCFKSGPDASRRADKWIYNTQRGYQADDPRGSRENRRRRMDEIYRNGGRY
jgi:hypothetical protein